MAEHERRGARRTGVPRWVAMLAVIALAVGAAACSQEDSGDDANDSSTETTEEKASSTTSTTEADEEEDTDTTEKDDSTSTSTDVDPWSRNAVEYRGQDGERVEFDCPPDGNLGIVWGTGTYTDDSSVCTAAVHAGLITVEEGGTVEIEIAPGQESYEASNANGVDSSSYGSWGGSFVFPDA